MNSFNTHLDCSDFELISLNESLKLTDHRHAVHCCLYTRSKTRFESYESPALISMQMRFDGRLGFAGGVVDRGQTVLGALQRELKEEINLNQKLMPADENYLCSHVQANRKLCLHSYAKELSLEEFKAMERDALSADDYGKETLGLIRVPLYTMIDGLKGFPLFLRNAFAGNAREQLLNFLIHEKLMSSEDIQAALKTSQRVQK